jgi:hypothetical protein
LGKPIGLFVAALSSLFAAQQGSCANRFCCRFRAVPAEEIPPLPTFFDEKEQLFARLLR